MSLLCYKSLKQQYPLVIEHKDVKQEISTCLNDNDFIFQAEHKSQSNISMLISFCFAFQTTEEHCGCINNKAVSYLKHFKICLLLI